MSDLTRRGVVLGTLFLAGAAPALSLAAGEAPAIHVVRGSGCGCCIAWVRYLKDQGFSVTDEEVHPPALDRYKVEKRVPQAMMSCHTATIGGYVVEGHVPAADIHRLVSERPDAVGIAVPDMPYGSPGMGPEDQREAYNVFLIRRDGSTEVFARYDAA